MPVRPPSLRPAACWLLLVPLLAGCLGAASDPDPPPAAQSGPDPAQGPEPRLPGPMREELAVTPGLDGAAEPLVGRCAAQPWCFDFPFTVQPGPDVAARAWLNWTLPTSDWDIDLVDGDGQVLGRAQGRGTALGESLEARLPPGEYAWVVVPYLVQRDAAVLEAAFSWA